MAASSTHSSVQAARRLRTTVVFIALTVILLALLVLNVCIGSVPVPVEDLFAILFNSG